MKTHEKSRVPDCPRVLSSSSLISAVSWLIPSSTRASLTSSVSSPKTPTASKIARKAFMAGGIKIVFSSDEEAGKSLPQAGLSSAEVEIQLQYRGPLGRRWDEVRVNRVIQSQNPSAHHSARWASVMQACYTFAKHRKNLRMLSQVARDQKTLGLLFEQ